jgi:hypothetical protein
MTWMQRPSAIGKAIFLSSFLKHIYNGENMLFLSTSDPSLSFMLMVIF